MRTLAALISAFCTATVLALAIGLAYLAVTGKLGRQKLAQVVAVMYGLQPLAPQASAETVSTRPAAGGELNSETLILHNHQLDERERFIAREQDALDMERGKLVATKAQLASGEEALKKRQTQWEASERAKGIDEAVLLMSKLSPSQAKDLILMRLSKNDMDWVVVLMRKLPADRQAKIAGEFTTQEETQKLDEIVCRIRDGQPPLSEPEKTQQAASSGARQRNEGGGGMVQLEPALAAPAAATTAPKDAGDAAAAVAPGEAPSFQDILRGSSSAPHNSDPEGNTATGYAAHPGENRPASAAMEGAPAETTENQVGSAGKPTDPSAAPTDPGAAEVLAAFGGKLAAVGHLGKTPGSPEGGDGTVLPATGETVAEPNPHLGRLGFTGQEGHHGAPLGAKPTSPGKNPSIASAQANLAGQPGGEIAVAADINASGQPQALGGKRGSNKAAAVTSATNQTLTVELKPIEEKTGDTAGALAALPQTALLASQAITTSGNPEAERTSLAGLAEGSSSSVSAASRGHAGRRGIAASTTDQATDGAAPNTGLLGGDLSSGERAADGRFAAQVLPGSGETKPPSDGDNSRGNALKLPAADSIGASQTAAAARGIRPPLADITSRSSDSATTQAPSSVGGSAELASAAADNVRFAQRVMYALQAAEARGAPVRLRLSPPELGTMRLELSMREGGLRARLEVETPTARTLLLDSLPHLHERLAAQDIKIERFQVDLMNQRTSDWPQGARDQQHAGNAGQGTARESNERAGSTDEPPVQATTWPWSDAQGIDVVI